MYNIGRYVPFSLLVSEQQQERETKFAREDFTGERRKAGMESVGSCLERPTLARERLYQRFRRRLVPNRQLDRKLVSFQANRRLPFYGWLKYKESFSAEFVRYIIQQLTDEQGVLLDPFAGTGTALFAARDLGWNVVGIELLPVGFFAILARIAAEELNSGVFKRELEKIEHVRWEDYFTPESKLHHIPITEGAFPEKTEILIAGYRAYCKQIRNAKVRNLFDLACLTILESISYTRKDGQYLRWDHRAGKHRAKSTFDKGEIAEFDSAIRRKLWRMYHDLCGKRDTHLDLFDDKIDGRKKGTLDLRLGSCLETLPQIDTESVDLVVTSPPYCNRYDYTRTYALELVYLGIDSEQIKQLRQNMLSCTVENRTKLAQLKKLYASFGHLEAFHEVTRIANRQRALQETLGILQELASANKLNNPNIPKMIKNYFLEMCFVIYELTRVLRPGGKVVMVNDNVRYAGEEIPVDLILSDFAEKFGMNTKNIWTLARGKGNSSQQMGAHGRTELRKCVYVWQKT